MTTASNQPGYEVFKDPDTNKIFINDLPSRVMLLQKNGRMDPNHLPDGFQSIWKAAVGVVADLPTLGNGQGDMRPVLLDATLWMCPLGNDQWVQVSGGGSGGGGPDVDVSYTAAIATAQAAAISAAATTAATLATAAHDTAVVTAASDATTKAATAHDTAVTTAAADATTKANAAVTTAGTAAATAIATALTTASTDAQSKASAALTAALAADPSKSTASLAANSPATSLTALAFDTANYAACKIDYLLKRGTFSNQMGSLRVFVLQDGSDVLVSEESVNSGAAAGVTFSAVKTGTAVTVDWAVDGSDAAAVTGEFVQVVFA
jgi:hypothetical protein